MTRFIIWSAALVSLALCGDPALSQALPITRFVPVDAGVKLEVLDWGGAGIPIVLLAGNTRTAHDYNAFAPKLSTSFHVYGITRRGVGASSAPVTGYDADRLADDVLAVIDSLHLVAPVLVGHSLAGEELSSIGSRFPQKVRGLVYLDAAYTYAFYWSGDYFVDANEIRSGMEEFQLAASKGDVKEARRIVTRLLETDLPSLERSLREVERQTPAAATNPPTPLMPPPFTGISRLMNEGQRRYTGVGSPVLAIYAGQRKDMPSSLAADPAAAEAWLAQRVPAVRALRQYVPTARIVILPEATHDVFVSNEADVLREVRLFVAGLPAQSAPPR